MTPIARPPSQPRANPPLRLDSVTIARRSLDISPSRSSVQSSRTHTPSSSVPSTPITSARAPSPEKKPLHPEDSNTFLTALAAQERRVLELKEELQKAEGELEVLKKQWASHEAAKKRNELRHLEQLQPLKVSSEGLPVAQGHDLKLSLQEQSRRKMAPPPVKSLQRTVFSGSRHARTLSLLSPKDSLPGSSFLLPSNGVTTRDRHIGDDSIVVKESSEQGNSNSRPNDSNGHDRGPPKDMILETGKQLVGDFRQGLWTFFEDLKQVTVGDEAANASDLRHQRTLPVENLPKAQIKRERGVDSKKGSAKDSTTLKREDSTRRQKAESSLHHDRVKSQQRAQLAPHSVPKSDPALLKDDDVLSDSDGGDEWDDWDAVASKTSTPRRKQASSVGNPNSSPLTDKSSPRTSTCSIDATPRPKKASESTGKRDDIPWPSITKLSPGRLTRTASTLMSEWERSLAPDIHHGAESSSTTSLKDQKSE